MKKKATIILIFALLLIASLPLVYSQAASWRGYVKISNATGNNLTAQAGTVVEGYVNGNFKTRITVKNVSTWDDGYYLIDVPGSTVDNVTFKVWNVSINGIDTTNQSWGVGWHPPPGSDNWFNLTISTLAAGATCTWSNACTGDYCCSGATECNGRCTGTCQASACAAAGVTQVSGGGGGGGAGGGAAETVTSETQTQPSISAGSSEEFTFLKSDVLAVTEITVTATADSTISTPSVTVKESSASALPSGVSVPVSSLEGSTYKYLIITKANVEDKQMAKATIKFKVEKSWFKNNKIDPDTVKLNRLVNNVWQELSTKKTGEDATYVHYEAETPGFSTFAITGKKKVAPTTAFGIIDEIRAFYAGTSIYTSFELIDIIRSFYAGG